MKKIFLALTLVSSFAQAAAGDFVPGLITRCTFTFPHRENPISITSRAEYTLDDAGKLKDKRNVVTFTVDHYEDLAGLEKVDASFTLPELSGKDSNGNAMFLAGIELPKELTDGLEPMRGFSKVDMKAPANVMSFRIKTPEGKMYREYFLVGTLVGSAYTADDKKDAQGRTYIEYSDFHYQARLFGFRTKDGTAFPIGTGSELDVPDVYGVRADTRSTLNMDCTISDYGSAARIR